MNSTTTTRGSGAGIRSNSRSVLGPQPNTDTSLAPPARSQLRDGAQRSEASRALRARAIALYLPQFHPIPENDEWWGKGFTEWTNTAKAKPMFRGHYQPHIPADLGFYDLRVPETREAQAALARRYGIEGFCYYHYWFAGRRILERPFNEVLHSGTPDFPFCLCWANQTWTGIWHGAPNRILIEQTYPGRADHEAHIRALLPAFADPRYIRVGGKPIFLIYRPNDLPDTAATLALWRTIAADAGLEGLHIAGLADWRDLNLTAVGFDAEIAQATLDIRRRVSRRQLLRWVRDKVGIWRGLPAIKSYQDFARRQMLSITAADASYPCVTHAWDNTPRSGRNGVVLVGATPELFCKVLNTAIGALQDRSFDQRLLFLKSWNEWAEGNHLEPDLEFGNGFLRAIADALGVEWEVGPDSREQRGYEGNI
jgi:lipopolysaccharide biosynthesis protein